MQIVRTVIVNDEQLKLIKKALMVASERDALDTEEQIEARILRALRA